METVSQTMDALWELPTHTRVQILTMWWHWWNNRNKLREGELPISSDDVVRRSISQADEFLELFGKGRNKNKADHTKWRPPADGVIKLNCDAAYNSGDSFATWGVAVRNQHGDLVAASAGKIDGIHDVFGAELNTLERAVDMATSLGALRAVFETDSELLAIALNRRGQDFSQLAASIDDLKIHLRSWFSWAEVVACRRSANKVAHQLAILGKSCNNQDFITWDGVVPATVAEFVVGDLPLVS